MYNIVLIGAGYMAEEYIKVLKMTNITNMNIVVIGNRQENCDRLTKEYNIKTYFGGLESNLNVLDTTEYVIIASPVNLLTVHLELVINKNIKNILIEKPAGLNINKLVDLSIEAENKNINVYVAYNRRFYNSVIIAKELIEEDGGPVLFNMDISEMLHTINIDKYDAAVLDNWLLSNTSHVIDLAIYLCGRPVTIKCHTQKGLEWNRNKNAIYAGSGITNRDCLFSYQGNWTGAGRWSLEIFTKNYTFLFCPLEELQIRKRGTVNFIKSNVPLESTKPGLFMMIQHFIFNLGEQSNETPILTKNKNMTLCKNMTFCNTNCWVCYSPSNNKLNNKDVNDCENLLTLKNHIQNMFIYDKINA